MLKSLHCLLLLSVLSGCAGTREITSLSQYLPDKEAPLKWHQSVDSLKKHYFTKEAYSAIRDIPTINGPDITPYAAGVNFVSNVASALTFNGVGRKVIADEDYLREHGALTLVHEYIHHLDDMDREEEGEFIDHDAFKKAYLMMANDQRWAGIVIDTERRANRFFTDVFGIGYMSEHIAYVGQFLLKAGGPDYMKHVYRKMLRIAYNGETIYRTVDGLVIRIKLGEE